MCTRSRTSSAGRWLARGGWLVLEISRVITVALELKARHADLLGEGFLAAFRTSGQRRIAELLHHIFLCITATASIFVNRHFRSCCLIRKARIISQQCPLRSTLKAIKSDSNHSPTGQRINRRWQNKKPTKYWRAFFQLETALETGGFFYFQRYPALRRNAENFTSAVGLG